VDFFRSHYEPIGQSTFLDDIELHRMYYFLTQLRDEFEPLRAQLLACYPCVSLMHALAEVRNEETCLYDAGLLRVSVTPTFCKNKTFCANRSTYKIIVLVKNFPKINLA
jgi:hypothetical protein